MVLFRYPEQRRSIKWLKKWVEDNRAVTDSVIQIVIVLATLMLAVLILAPLQQQAGERVETIAKNNTQINTTWTAIVDAAWGALSMFSIVPYVVVFIVILGLILMIGRRT